MQNAGEAVGSRQKAEEPGADFGLRRAQSSRASPVCPGLPDISLPTAHCPLPSAHCLLPTAFCRYTAYMGFYLAYAEASDASNSSITVVVLLVGFFVAVC